MNILLIYIGFFILLFIIIFIIQSIKIRNLSTKPRNKVRFFVTRDNNVCNDDLRLWMGKPKWNNVIKRWVYYSMRTHCLCVSGGFKSYNLNPDDFTDMKECEIREVFLNLED